MKKHRTPKHEMREPPRPAIGRVAGLLESPTAFARRVAKGRAVRSRFPPGRLARRVSLPAASRVALPPPDPSGGLVARAVGGAPRAPVAAMDSRDGIQKLLAAEQEAQAIVTAARAEKTSRLRQAKAEADAEIAAYRAQREEKYQSLLSSRVGDSSARAARLETDAAAAIERVQAQVNAGKKAVTDMLAAKVTSA